MTGRVPFQDFRREYDEVLRQELPAACERVFRSGHYVLGVEVEAFEREFAGAVGRRHGVGVASGLDALMIALRVAGVGPGDEVITTPLTAAATALAVTHVGGVPVFVDVDAETLTLDPAEVERAFGPRTKAVLPVHLYGAPADVVRLAALCRERRVPLIEDCAQAHLAEVGGVPVGGFGVLAGYSFYPTKNLGAIGDAGLITTDNAELAAACRRYRDYGQAAKYEHVVAGYNSRLDELQAAILRVKLPHLPAWTEARRRLAARYHEILAGAPIALPRARAGTTPVWHLFPVRTADRDRLARGLADSGVATAIHYPRAIPDQPCYREAGACRVVGQLPVARRAAAETLSLPLFPLMRGDEQDLVAAAVRETLGG
jgi:dTDP-3-amino-3,4,6-trideoxy-alpha-D-glucose transaminase